MGYDLYPLTTLETRKKWLPRAARENWTVVFGHEAHTPVPARRAIERKFEAIRSAYSQIARIIEGQEKRKARKAQNAKDTAEIGIIGGSGLYSMSGLRDSREVRIKTPFGDPSDALILGNSKAATSPFSRATAADIAFSPSEINYRANICAMKMLGVERIISASAVGSLKEDLRPLDFLIPDQFYDKTRLRIATFFGDGVVAHVGFDKPMCAAVAEVLARCVQNRSRKSSQRRHLRLHGGSAIFHARRGSRSSPVALRCRWHD